MQASVVLHPTKWVIHVGKGWNHGNTIQKLIFIYLHSYHILGQIEKLVSLFLS